MFDVITSLAVTDDVTTTVQPSCALLRWVIGRSVWLLCHLLDKKEGGEALNMTPDTIV